MPAPPSIPIAASRQPVSVLTRLSGSLTVGGSIGVVAGFLGPWQVVPLAAWVGAALIWVISVWISIGRLDPAATSQRATREDPHGAASDLLLLSASVASLVAVLLGVLKAANVHGVEKGVLLGVGIGSIVCSWGMVHTVFTLRYAALYYKAPEGGVDFNDDTKPSYLDFAYLAFTIGMTYQVSDTDLKTKDVRHTALRHAALSYLFGTVIIAATINLAAGLAK